MKIIVHIEGGQCAGVYHEAQVKDVVISIPEVIIVDTDGMKVGEGLQLERLDVEPLAKADREVKSAVRRMA